MSTSRARAIAWALCAWASLASAAGAELATLEEYMARYLAAGRSTLKEGGQCLEADQQEWLKRVRNACRDTACLEAAYLARLGELDPLQPGVTAIRNLELPRRRSLAWVVPPAADRVAAPPNPAAKPAEITGTILDELAGGDGFVLRDAGGQRFLIAMLMFLDGDTTSRLQQLASDNARFTIRGHVATDPRGARYFEPSRCVFVYRDLSGSPGTIHANPRRTYGDFKPHELAFETPQDGVARGEFKSAPFHAVILKTATRCAISEAERLEAQALFPANKVFSTRFGCGDGVEENVTYTNVNADWGFIAVYAGSTAGEAQAVLERVRKTGRFPGANLRRMQAVLVYP